MRKLNKLLVMLTFLLPGVLSAQVYVNQAASGDNDGSSWANAYTSLQDAIGDTTASEIWVAAGTYVPPGSNVETTRFFINRSTAIYGGFAGTEANRNDRNPVTNVTTLSGDIDGNDVAGDFVTNRADNSYHILYVDSLVTGGVLVDGFTVSGAHTSDTSSISYLNEGGGLYAFSPVLINNCNFNNNYARTGASYFLNGIGTSGSQFSNCVFSTNRAANFGSVGFLINTANITFSKNEIRENVNTRGGGITNFFGGNILIDSCTFVGNRAEFGIGGAILNYDCGTMISNSTFEKNIATSNSPTVNGFGAAIFAQAVNFRNTPLLGVVNCTFTENESQSQGAAIYNVQSDQSFISQNTFSKNVSSYGAVALVDCDSVVTANNNFTENSAYNGGGVYLLFTTECMLNENTFEDNVVNGDGGGGILALQANYEANDCVFRNNDSPGSGAAVYNAFPGVHRFNDCEFAGNESGFGGAILDYSGQSFYKGCSFVSNTATSSGGAYIGGFRQRSEFEDCLFKSNQGRFAGAIRSQNDSTIMMFSNCDFESNIGTTAGGALGLTQGGLFGLEDCDFTSNESPDGVGGAIYITEDSLDYASLMIDRCNFIFNNAAGQGGALNISNADVMIINSILALNTAESEVGADTTGRGGAISNNASKYTRDFVGNVTGTMVSDTSKIFLMNCTIAENDGEFAGSIAQWEESDSTNGVAIITMQNNIFYQKDGDGSVYDQEAGDPEVISNGGNICNDATLTSFLGNSMDHPETDPMLTDPFNEEFDLLAGSPAIDGAVAANGAPLYDQRGADMSGNGKDIGALEFQLPVGTEELISGNALMIRPNPVSAMTKLFLDNDWSGELQIKVINNIGQIVQTQKISKANGQLIHDLDATDLDAGLYRVTISNGKQLIVKSLVKI